jgi:uncharacterized DUF497 family protein
MIFEWDEAKNIANVRKHGIDFERAVAIFEGPVLTFNDERFDYGELRQLSIGRLADMLIATVIHTDRNGRRRIVSARPASPKERKLYAPPL